MSAPKSVGDHYELLEITRAADPDTIKQAVRTQRRKWLTRQNSPSVERQREAEDRLVSIAAAEVELSNPDKRSAYDSWLTSSERQPTLPGSDAPPVGTPGSSSGGHTAPTAAAPGPPAPRMDMLARAAMELDRGDQRNARYFAKEAIENRHDDHRAWAFLSTVSQVGHRWDDAIVEMGEAIKYHRSADYLGRLGEINNAAGYWADSAAAFQAAADLDPDEPAYALSAAQVWLGQYRPDLATPILENLHGRHPDRDDISHALAEAISLNVTSYLTQLHNGTVAFTSAAQVSRATSELQRALGLSFSDATLRAQLTGQQRDAIDATKQVWSFPPRATQGALWIRRLGWFFAGWIALAIPMNLVKSPEAIGVLLGFAALGCLVWLFVKLYRKPAWQRNAAKFAPYVRQWGV